MGFHDSSANRCQGEWRRRCATTFPGKSATTLQDKFRDRNAQTYRGRNVKMCRGNSAAMSLARNVRTSPASSATTSLARLLGKSATTSPGRFATACQERSATVSQGSSAPTFQGSSVPMFQDSSATTSLVSSVSRCPSRCAMLPSQPTEESRLRELMKTRNEDAESRRRRITRGNKKRHLKLLSKLPGWSQQSYLFLLCNIYGILVKPRVLSRVNKNLKPKK